MSHNGSFSIRLSNGKKLTTMNAGELACFYESDGASITSRPRRKGGKSKGARNRGKSKVIRTRDA